MCCLLNLCRIFFVISFPRKYIGFDILFKLASVVHLDTHPTGHQEVVVSNHAGLATFFLED